MAKAVQIKNKRDARFACGRRRGMSLVELLIASSIMALTVAAIASLGSASQSAADYGISHGGVVEQGRMITNRIARSVEEAMSNENFPGFVVISTLVDGRIVSRRAGRLASRRRCVRSRRPASKK